MSEHTQGRMDFGPGESGPYQGERAPTRDPRGRRPRHYWRITRTSPDGAPEYWRFTQETDAQGTTHYGNGWTTDPAKAHRFPTWSQANWHRKTYHIDPEAITEDTGISY